MSVEETIRKYIIESFLSEQEVSLGSDDDLLLVLDSLQILRTVIELERRFELQVDNSELTPENLGTVNRLTAFVNRKRSQQPDAA